jgi:hypothetical protein
MLSHREDFTYSTFSGFIAVKKCLKSILSLGSSLILNNCVYGHLKLKQTLKCDKIYISIITFIHF